jgi:hypothetical protein
LDWGFPSGAEDTLKTEIHYADNAAGDNAMLLADIPYPLHTHNMTGLKAGARVLVPCHVCRTEPGISGTGPAGLRGNPTRTLTITLKALVMAF